MVPNYSIDEIFIGTPQLSFCTSKFVMFSPNPYSVRLVGSLSFLFLRSIFNLSRFFSLIPIPVSLTSASILSGSSLFTEKLIVMPPLKVNLMALRSRFVRIWDNYFGLDCIVSGTSGEIMTSNVRFRISVLSFCTWTTLATISLILVGSGLILTSSRFDYV